MTRSALISTSREGRAASALHHVSRRAEGEGVPHRARTIVARRITIIGNAGRWSSARSFERSQTARLDIVKLLTFGKFVT